MELNDWILALHLLSAFALVGALTLFSILIVALWGVDRPVAVASYMRVAAIGNVLVIIGTVGTVVFGIWLALSVDGYEIWDGWVLAALVLWAISSELGRRAGAAYNEAGTRAEELAKSGDEPSPELRATFGTWTTLRYHALSSVLVLLILIDMVWKPGA